MCYLIYISTESSEDLSQHNSALIRFEKDFGYCAPEVVDLLQYEYPWYVASKAGCSCNFRHLSSIELGFVEPVEWYEESSDEIEATRIFYDIASSLILSGKKIDCIDIWTETRKDQIQHLKVVLTSIRRDAFRFFENYHFVFSHTQ